MSEILVEREMARDTICQHISYIPFNQLPVGGMCISEDDYDSSDDTVVEEQQKTFLEVKESTMASNKTTTDKIRIEDRLNNLSVEYLDCEPASQAQEQLRNLLDMKMRKAGIPRTEEVLGMRKSRSSQPDSTAKPWQAGSVCSRKGYSPAIEQLARNSKRKLRGYSGASTMLSNRSKQRYIWNVPLLF